MTAKPKFDAEGRLLLSFSAVDRFRQCGVAFLNAIEDPRPPTSRMVVGRAFDRTVKEGLRLFQENGETPPDDDVADRAREAASDAWAAGVHFVDDEEARGRALLGEIADKAVRASVKFIREHVPTLKPKVVDRWIRYVVNRDEGKPVVVRGEIDLEEEDGTVRDIKWRSKSPDWHEAATSLQLSLYAAEAMLTAPDGDPRREEVRVARDVYVDLKTPKIVAQVATRNPEQVDSAIAVVQGVATALDKGVFLPASPFADWWCSPSHCRWWSTCPISKPFRGLTRETAPAIGSTPPEKPKAAKKIVRMKGRKVVIR